ncbi:MAG: nucleotidyltransferase domain-containing protein [Deltaproteobacteria bacterium]|nr:nucleotidyltransferase domain-containing protein [Deltaproteobacteria bacterium]
MIHPTVQDHLTQIRAVLQDNKVQKAYFFGSVCTEDFTDKSDIDIIINFQEGLDPLTRGDLWWNVYFSLEEMLKRPIDLLTENSIENPYLKKELERTMQEIL